MRAPLAILVAIILASAATPSGEAASEPELYLVGFYGRPDVDPGDHLYGATVVATIPDLSLVVLATTNPGALHAGTRADDRVRYVEADASDHRLLFVPNDPLYTHAAHWGSKRIGAETAWDLTRGSTAVKVAMVDSGINRGHEEYAGQSRVLQGHDFKDGDNDPEDTRGCSWHGTHTTGTAGATLNNGKGIAGISQHTILPVKIFGKGFGGCGTTTSAIVGGLKFAGDQGAHVSSNSWGGGSSSTAINDAIAYAHNKGVIHVAAAGNSGPCTNCVGQPWKDNPSITLVVSSLSQGDTFSSFSSEGPDVDVIAPGGNIASSTSGTADYHAYSGTSMAAPHVAGAIALVIATGTTGFTNVENKLKSTTEDLGFSSSRQGAGLVRADLAVGGGGGGGGNNAPTASFTFNCTDLACSFNGGGSSDSDGPITSYAWDFGDGTTGSGATPSHTFTAGGTYTVTLTVTDNAGGTDSDGQSVSVSEGGSGSGITLSVSGYKLKGVKHGDLSWSGTISTNVDVYRNGAVVATTANDGAFTDSTGQKGGGSTTWRVCEAGTTTCSNDATWTW